MDDMVECNGDYSWVDDIRFDALRSFAQAGGHVYYGGEIHAPLAQALEKSGVDAKRCDSAREALDALDATDPERTQRLYVIANYHALERVRAELMRMED